MTKLIRVTTVPVTLVAFCTGLLRELQEQENYEVVAVSSPGEELNKLADSRSYGTPHIAIQGPEVVMENVAVDVP